MALNKGDAESLKGDLALIQHMLSRIDQAMTTACLGLVCAGCGSPLKDGQMVIIHKPINDGTEATLWHPPCLSMAISEGKIQNLYERATYANH